MGSRSLLLFSVVSTMVVAGAVGFAQSPTFGVGRAPTTDEIRAWDISIRPDGQELPPGHGTAKDGAPLYVLRTDPARNEVVAGPRDPNPFAEDHAPHCRTCTCQE